MYLIRLLNITFTNVNVWFLLMVSSYELILFVNYAY